MTSVQRLVLEYPIQPSIQLPLHPTYRLWAFHEKLGDDSLQDLCRPVARSCGLPHPLTGALNRHPSRRFHDSHGLARRQPSIHAHGARGQQIHGHRPACSLQREQHRRRSDAHQTKTRGAGLQLVRQPQRLQGNADKDARGSCRRAKQAALMQKGVARLLPQKAIALTCKAGGWLQHGMPAGNQAVLLPLPGKGCLRRWEWVKRLLRHGQMCAVLL